MFLACVWVARANPAVMWFTITSWQCQIVCVGELYRLFPCLSDTLMLSLLVVNGKGRMNHFFAKSANLSKPNKNKSVPFPHFVLVLRIKLETQEQWPKRYNLRSFCNPRGIWISRRLHLHLILHTYQMKLSFSPKQCNFWNFSSLLQLIELSTTYHCSFEQNRIGKHVFLHFTCKTLVQRRVVFFLSIVTYWEFFKSMLLHIWKYERVEFSSCLDFECFRKMSYLNC